MGGAPPPWEQEGETRLADSLSLALGKQFLKRAGLDRSSLAKSSCPLMGEASQFCFSNRNQEKGGWRAMAYFMSKWSLPTGRCYSLHHIPVLRCGLPLPKPNRKGEEKGSSSYATFTTGGLGAPRTPSLISHFPFPYLHGGGRELATIIPGHPHTPNPHPLLGPQSPRQPLLLCAILLPHACLPLNSGALRGCVT